MTTHKKEVIEESQRIAGEFGFVVFSDNESLKGRFNLRLILSVILAFIMLCALCGCQTQQPTVAPTPTNSIPLSTNPQLPPLPPSPQTLSSESFDIAAHPKSLLTVMSVPTNEYAITVELAWDAETNVNGYALYVGNQSGIYSVRLDEGMTNDVELPWDSQQPLFVSVASYVTNPWPEIVQVKGYPLNTWTTNYVTESMGNTTAFYMPSNAQPFITVSNGMAIYTAYGFTNVDYTVNSTQDFTNWESVLITEGTNGPFTYSESLTNNVDYFQLMWITNQ